MGFPQALVALVGAAGLAALILLVLGSIYFEATNSELPAGLEQPARLRVIHACRIGAAVLVRRRAGGSAARAPREERLLGPGRLCRRAAVLLTRGKGAEPGGRREDPACAPPQADEAGREFPRWGELSWGSRGAP